MLQKECIFIPPNAMLESITEVCGPGCSIQRFTIIDNSYYIIIGSRPLPDGSLAPALWTLEPKRKVISIHPILPVLPGGEILTNAQEV